MSDAWGRVDECEEFECSVDYLEELGGPDFEAREEFEFQERVYYVKAYAHFVRIYDDDEQWAHIFAYCRDWFQQDLCGCKQLAIAMMVVCPIWPSDYNKCILLAQVFETMRCRGVTFEQAKAGFWNGGFYAWVLRCLGNLEQVDLRVGPLSEKELPRRNFATGLVQK